MEVLMHERTRLASRALFGALAVIISLGSLFYIVKVHRARAVAAGRYHFADARQGQSGVPSLAAVTVTPAAVATGSSNPDQSDISGNTLVTTTPPITSNALAQNTPTTRPIALSASAVTPTIVAPRVLPVVAAPATAPTVAPGDLAGDVRAKTAAGDLVAARDELNAALISGHLPDADADATRHSIAEINQTLVFSPHRTPNDPWATGYPVQSGERLSSIAAKNDVTWQLLSRINKTDPKRLRSGSTIKVVKGPFFAVVTKSKFRMDIYLGGPGGADSMYVTSFAVGLGKNDSTPTGTWQVQTGNKILHPTYYSPENQGVIAADDPKNPLGGFWIGLEGVDGEALDKHSYGIHGTIDPDSIGKQASMGCIRLAHDDIALTFEMLVEGKSKIVVNP
jgi:lipoprotein-anchoring transpeptidase ErfK/SrfK